MTAPPPPRRRGRNEFPAHRNEADEIASHDLVDELRRRIRKCGCRKYPALLTSTSTPARASAPSRKRAGSEGSAMSPANQLTFGAPASRKVFAATARLSSWRAVMTRLAPSRANAVRWQRQSRANGP